MWVDCKIYCMRGQVVGVHGLNPAGNCLVANQLITSLPRPFPTSTPDDLQRFTIATGRTERSSLPKGMLQNTVCAI